MKQAGLEGVKQEMRHTIVIERAPRNYAAYVPDLPGCVATGDTREDAVREIRQAIRYHIESLREHREGVPEPQCTATRCRRCRRRVSGLQLVGIVENMSHARMVSCARAGRCRVRKSASGCSC